MYCPNANDNKNPDEKKLFRITRWDVTRNLREAYPKIAFMQISHWRAGEEYGNSSPRVKFRIHKSQVFSIPNYTNSPGKTSPRDVHSALEFSKQLLASKGENKGRKKQDTLRGEREEKKRAALTSNDIARLSRLTRALNNLPPAGRAYETRREDRAQV